MINEQINLNWLTYTDHLQEMMQNLMLSNESSDVTLVCDDKIKLKAHQFVLSTCSPLFHSIVNGLPQKEGSVIYLRGVLSSEMKSILQFMYLGHATLYQERINQFLNVAKSLEIKGVNVDDDTNDKILEKEHKGILPKDEHFNETEPIIKQSETEDDIKPIDVEIAKKTNDLHSCNNCNKEFRHKHNLDRHIKSIHEGKRYPCSICDQTFTQKTRLYTHIEGLHDGKKYTCKSCNQNFARKDNLAVHIKAFHEFS